jgi:hypothetical protein
MVTRLVPCLMSLVILFHNSSRLSVPSYDITKHVLRLALLRHVEPLLTSIVSCLATPHPAQGDERGRSVLCCRQQGLRQDKRGLEPEGEEEERR